MEEEKKRAALYARVSTDEQAQEGYSLDAQLDVMRAYCDIHELEIAGEYVDDGYSGTNIRRNAYNFMFSPDERKKWDVLIVMKMDRIHRNSRNFMDMMQDLNRHKQQFISTYDRIDTSTAVGRFAMDMIQRIAQLESEQIGERTYMGMREKAESFAGILGFNAPFGYSFEDGKLVIVEDEAEIVREIYNRYQNGSTMDEIAFYLNTNHLLTKNNNPWNKYNLRTVLHNPTYAGYLHWEEIIWKADHEPIIDPEFFNEIQLLIASKIRNPAHRKCIRLETDT